MKLTKFASILITLLLTLSQNLIAQDAYEEAGFYTGIRTVSRGVLFTDNYASAIYLFDGKSVTKIISSAGCGYYYTTDAAGNIIGYKRIDGDGRQTPVLYDIRSNSAVSLAAASGHCGQPSFSFTGDIAFTVGNTLHIKRAGGSTEKHDLGTYANIVALSPDGSSAAYADAEERINILNLRTPARSVISGEAQGFFNPRWSPDGTKLLYSRLNAELFVYDCLTHASYALGTGYEACWNAASSRVLLSRRTVEDMRLKGADIYEVSFDGLTETRLSDSDELFEHSAGYDAEGRIVFSAINAPVLLRAARAGKATSAEELYRGKPEITYHIVTADVQKAIDIPYVNQVYDTPDWFNGHSACGATTAIMKIAYYNLLPRWDGWCSTPTGHYNSWGRYVSDWYRFREMNYTYSANDPNGTPGYGGFGYTWSGGSPYSRMGYYYNNHGLSSYRVDAPSFQLIASELDSVRPYSMCNGLTTSGHIILMNGKGTAVNSLVANDPYGNKNNPGYPNYTGKNAVYDWPGYNNGHKNLNTVYWGIGAKFKAPVLSDTLVDDLHFTGGFYLHTFTPASMKTYSDMNSGYDGHYWSAFTTTGADVGYALWKPVLNRSGVYEIFAFIPAGATSSAAQYKINDVNGITTKVIDQGANQNTWVSLGEFTMNAGSTGFVRLGDATVGENRKVIAFDAVRFSFKSPSSGEEEVFAPEGFALEQNYPNPFNPVTTIRYEVGKTTGRHSTGSAAHVRLSVYNAVGKEVAVLVNEAKPAGEYAVSFDASLLSSGTYFYELRAGDFRETKKMTLLR